LGGKKDENISAIKKQTIVLVACSRVEDQKINNIDDQKQKGKDIVGAAQKLFRSFELFVVNKKHQGHEQYDRKNQKANYQLCAVFVSRMHQDQSYESVERNDGNERK